VTTSTDQIADILNSAKTIAVVGLSSSPIRPSYGVTAYMQLHGYRIIPVNPGINGALARNPIPRCSTSPRRSIS